MPLSVDTYAEIFKQSDPATLRVTVELIDELSMGVSILELRERHQLETFHFIREKTKGSQAVYALNELAWTKSAYVLGFVTPVSKTFQSDLSTTIQKAFVDQMWVTTLVDMYAKQLGVTPQRYLQHLVEDDLAASHREKKAPLTSSSIRAKWSTRQNWTRWWRKQEPPHHSGI